MVLISDAKRVLVHDENKPLILRNLNPDPDHTVTTGSPSWAATTTNGVYSTGIDSDGRPFSRSTVVTPAASVGVRLPISPVTPGAATRHVTLRVRTSAPTGTVIRLRLDVANASGTNIDTTSSTVSVSATSGVWHTLTISRPAPTDPGGVNWRPVIFSPNLLEVGFTVDVRDVTYTDDAPGPFISPTLPLAGYSITWDGVPNASSCTAVRVPELANAAYLGGDRIAHRRVNLIVDPQARTSAIWTANRWFGSGASGSYTIVTGATDGPLPGITSYRRKTWSVQGASGDSGFQVFTASTAGAQFFWVPELAGKTVFAYLRHSSSTTKTFQMRVLWRDSANNAYANTAGTSVTNVPAGVWTKVSVTLPSAPPNVLADRMILVPDAFAGSSYPFEVGATLDGTGLFVGDGDTYFDGSAPIRYRTNYCRNPRLAPIDGGYWAGTGAGTTSAGRYTLTEADNPPPGMTHAFRLVGTDTASGSRVYVQVYDLVPGRNYAASAWIKADGATGSFRVAEDSNVQGVQVLNSFADSVGQGWVRISSTFTASASLMYFQMRQVGAWTGPMQYMMTGVVVEDANGAEGTYFDGSLPPASSLLRAAWAGAEHNSASYLTDRSAPEWTGTPHASPSTLWATY